MVPSRDHAHRSRSVPTHCCSDRSSLSRAFATPNPIARFIKHVKLCLLQRYIEPDMLRHWLPSGCCVAITKLYPSRNKSSDIGSRDTAMFHHLSLFCVAADLDEDGHGSC
jgi:hypothetical protein